MTSPKNSKSPKPAVANSRSRYTFPGRDGLGAYITSPESYPQSRVIYHNENFVVINDLYPKSSIHLLILPRDKTKMLLHPIDAFEDKEFLASVQYEAAKVKAMAASELRRRYGKNSATEQIRTEAMDADPPPDTLPAGRDWEKEILVGIHSGPSMNHLHVHVMSVDRQSVCLRHKKHYNSFATPFLVRLEEFPLARDDIRRERSHGGYLRDDMVCWRCGKNFGSKFEKLKIHLKEEFEQWKSE